MNLQDYKKQRKKYGSLAKVVKQILKSAIKKSEHPYNLFDITARAKTIKSLSGKLKKEEYKENNHEVVETFVKDLAGCRAIFYLNHDVTIFHQSAIIKDNFTVHKIKHHYPDPNNPSKYIAEHYVVELKDSHQKFADLQGMKCEIQVQTILNHAWSETMHDITYKSSGFNTFGSDAFQNIKSELDDVMTKYLLPAGHKLQNLANDYKNLQTGKDIYETNILNIALNDIDNDERFSILERFQRHVIPNYNRNELALEIHNIIETLGNIIIKAKEFPIKTIETPFGSFSGKSFNDIFSIALNILDYIRYQEPQKIFFAFIELYRTYYADENLRKKIVCSIELLATYNINVLTQVGHYVQNSLISLIERWGDATLLSLDEIVIKVCEEILTLTVRETSATHNQFQFKDYTLSATGELSKNLKLAVNILKRLYCLHQQFDEKQKILQALSSITPCNKIRSQELFSIVLNILSDIINFYTTLIFAGKYEILMRLESEVFWLKYHYGRLSKSHQWNEEVVEQSEKLNQSALIFYVQIRSNESYIAYKTLISVEFRSEAQWLHDEDPTISNEQYRLNEIEKYVSEVNEKNWVTWEEIILQCAQTTSRDFNFLIKFLVRLARSKSNFTLNLVEVYAENLSRLLPQLLNALLKSNSEKEIEALLSRWVAEGKYLTPCAGLLQFDKSLSLELLKKIFQKAKERNDKETLRQLVTSVITGYEINQHTFIAALFIPSLHALTQLEDASWVFYAWYLRDCKIFFSSLSEDEVDQVLNNLLFLKTVDYHAEEVLSMLADRYPEKIIRFFIKRISKKSSGRYEAIPYENFSKLNIPLAKIPNAAVDIVSADCHDNYRDFIHSHGRLLKNIFPELPEPFENKLLTLVRTKEGKNLLVVMEILKNYHGEKSTHKICKEILQIMPEEKGGSRVKSILGSTGATFGELGIVEAFKRKREELKEWLQDEDEKVRAFAKEYIEQLETSIAAERKRVEEDIELRKHYYGANE